MSKTVNLARISWQRRIFVAPGMSRKNSAHAYTFDTRRSILRLGTRLTTVLLSPGREPTRHDNIWSRRRLSHAK